MIFYNNARDTTKCANNNKKRGGGGGDDILRIFHAKYRNYPIHQKCYENDTYDHILFLNKYATKLSHFFVSKNKFN